MFNKGFSPEAEAILNKLIDSGKPFAFETLNEFDFRRKGVKEVLVRHAKDRIALTERAQIEIMMRMASGSGHGGGGGGKQLIIIENETSLSEGLTENQSIKTDDEENAA
jgi:hypothetical protein